MSSVNENVDLDKKYQQLQSHVLSIWNSVHNKNISRTKSTAPSISSGSMESRGVSSSWLSKAMQYFGKI
jgi:hypothetical protein